MNEQATDERAGVTAALATMLAALTLSPLIEGRTWLVVAAVAVLSVMVCGIVARQVTRWWPLVVLAQLGVLTITITALFARSQAVAGVLPGPEAVLRFRQLLTAASEVTAGQAPPVEASQGIVLLVVLGIGGVALVVDALSASLRQPALAGLPLLAVYCVPAALLPGGLPWYYFVLAAAGFLLLLSADSGDRIRSWGRVLTSATAVGRANRPGGQGLDGLASGGRRVGAVVVATAVLVPALLPGLGDRLLSSAGGEGDGDGATIRTINPILRLKDDLVSGDDTVLIDYSTSVKEPEPLRIVTADVYEGTTWAPRRTAVPRENRVQDGLPPPPGLIEAISAASVQTSIRIRNLQQSYLPVPYPAQRVNVRGRWLYDSVTLNIVGEGIGTRGLSYTVDHLDVRPTPQQLAQASDAPPAQGAFLQLPDTLPVQVRQVARDVAKNGSDYQQAVRLQRWFRQGGGFTYSTRAPVNRKGDGSVDAMAAFLERKSGYCVHFASTMAAMARSLGIPARVGVGFLPGELQPGGNRVIRASDAHAWPELYFQDVGWVRFEPTPRTGVATPPAWAVPPSGALPEDVDPTASEAAPSAQATPSVDPTQGRADRQQDTTSSTVGDRLAAVPWRLVMVIAVLLLAAVLPLIAATLRTRRRWRRARSSRELAEAAWEELRQRLTDLGVRWAASWTPRALQRRLVTDMDLGSDEQAALGRLVSELEAARYAPPTDEPGRSRDQRSADVGRILGAAREAVPARARHRGRWLPASGVRAITDTARRADESATSVGQRVGRVGGDVGSRLLRRTKTRETDTENGGVTTLERPSRDELNP